MAIVQSSLTEEILSRQEKAVIRGIYRAQQLSEAYNALEKMTSDKSSTPKDGNANSGAIIIDKSIELKRYLASAIDSALINIKVPAISRAVKENPSPAG